MLPGAERFRELPGLTNWVEHCLDGVRDPSLAAQMPLDQEYWVLLTPFEADEIWFAVTEGREAGGKFLAFPVVVDDPFLKNNHYIDLPEDIETKMVMADRPEGVLEAIRGKELVVWSWRNVQRHFNRLIETVDQRVSHGRIAFDIQKESREIAEIHDDLGDFAINGGPSLEIPEDGKCSNLLVARWAAEVVSFILGVQDTKRLFASD